MEWSIIIYVVDVLLRLLGCLLLTRISVSGDVCHHAQIP